VKGENLTFLDYMGKVLAMVSCRGCAVFACLIFFLSIPKLLSHAENFKRFNQGLNIQKRLFRVVLKTS